MKLFNLALFILSLGIGTSTPLWAADAPQETNAYQSSFDDYKPLSDDNNLADWKSINVPSNGGGHAGHSMAGMQHNMTPKQMANMPADSKEMPSMEGMDHSSMQGMKKVAPDDMKGMDHSQMKNDKTMAPMAEMDHSKMAGMNQDNMKPMPESKSAMQPMKKEDMPEMNHEEMAGHDHGGSDMKAMDHSKMNESTPNDMQPSQEATVQDESQPHQQSSKQGDEDAGMSMPSMVSTAQATSWQIIPNFHPIVVHFPIALTVIAFLLSIAAYVRRSHPVSAQLAAAGHFTLWLAALGAAAAVLFGWLAFNSISNHDDAGHAAMLLHRAWAIPTAIGLILLASWDAWKYRINELISVPMLFLLFLLSQAIAVTAWLGGEVVYRYGIGVLSIPSSASAGHGQHKGADATATPEAEPDELTEKNDDKKGESHAH